MITKMLLRRYGIHSTLTLITLSYAQGLKGPAGQLLSPLVLRYVPTPEVFLGIDAVHPFCQMLPLCQMLSLKTDWSTPERK